MQRQDTLHGCGRRGLILSHRSWQVSESLATSIIGESMGEARKCSQQWGGEEDWQSLISCCSQSPISLAESPLTAGDLGSWAHFFVYMTSASSSSSSFKSSAFLLTFLGVVLSTTCPMKFLATLIIPRTSATSSLFFLTMVLSLGVGLSLSGISKSKSASPSPF